MMKAIWNGTVIAESNETIEVEGNPYFPPHAVQFEFLKKTNTNTTCPWKGEASYYSIEVNGQVNKDAAWYYPEPFDPAKSIKNYIAFWHGVEIIQ